MSKSILIFMGLIFLSFLMLVQHTLKNKNSAFVPKTRRDFGESLLLLLGLTVLYPIMLASAYDIVRNHAAKNDSVDAASFQEIRENVEVKLVTIRMTDEVDRNVLKEMISNQDDQFKSAFVDVFGNSLSPELVEFKSNDLSFTMVNSDGKIVGQVLFGASRDYCMNVSYWVDQKFRRKGYASEALKQTIKSVMKDNLVTCLEFEIAKENIASMRALEKAYKSLKSEENLDIYFDKVSRILECKVTSNRNDKLSYDMELHNNQELICKNKISKNELLKITSEENINSGVIAKREYFLCKIMKD